MAYRPTLQGSGRPKPFQRKVIVVSTDVVNDGAKKEWRDVSPFEVEVGDIIVGKGLVESGNVDEYFDRKTNTHIPYVDFTMKNGNVLRYAQGDVVRAFTRIRG
jgi:hypothetical protein